MKYPGNESITLEFKSSLPKNDQIIKTVIAFCNQHGGKIILGVEDNGEITGLDENQAVEAMDYLETAILSASSPPILPKVYSQRIADKLLLVIEVSEGMNKPYYRHAEGVDKGTYIRVGCHTVRATKDMVEELRWQSRGISFENLPVYQAEPSELDHEKIKHFLDHRRQSIKTNPDEAVLHAYKLVVDEHAKSYPTVAGILLFGKRVQHYFPEAMIICSHFKGTQGREAIASIDCNGTLFEQYEQAYHFIISRLTHAYKITPTKREETLEIPPIALREILLNAIIHRNYHLRAPNKIAIYDDRIEIFSPGNFPSPLPNLQLGLTDARNMTLCRIFREANLVEKLGSGFITTFQSYEAWKLPKPIVQNGDGFVKCILPKPGYQGEATEDSIHNILQLFNTVGTASVSDVMQACDLPRSTASRKLSQMVKDGLLVSTGTGRSTLYKKP